ncbi:MAG: hypothetical protein WC140_00955 [Bacteroidales bacterium]
MKSTYQHNIIISLFLTLLMFISSFFIDIDVEKLYSNINYLNIFSKIGTYLFSHLIFSNFLAVCFLILISISLYYVNESYLQVARNSWTLSFIFIFLVSMAPSCIYFSKYHIAGLLIIWALYYNVRFIMEEKYKRSSIFMNILILSLISLILPKFIWLEMLVLIFNLMFGKVHFLKYFLISLSAILLPFLYVISINFLSTGGFEIQAFITGFTSRIFFDPFSIHMGSMTSNILTSLIIFSFIYILISMVNRYNKFTVNKKIYLGLLTFYAGIVFSLMVFNDFSGKQSLSIIFYTLSSTLIFECFYNTKYKKFISILIGVGITMIFLDRISIFLI